MSLSHGPSIATSGLVFFYDMQNIQKSWKGKPATNTCSFGTYNDGYNSTKISNATPPVPPPVTGYPIYKITSNDGNDAQQILYTATVDQVNGGTYTHSAYVYLEYGTWVSAGQHWNPWDYGTQQYIPNGVWTRIEDPVTNSGNNYGNVALSYNTNGAVYVTGSQYEIGSFASPLVNGTRSNTQAIVDLTGNNTVTINNLTYASSGTFSFNGSSDYITVPFNSSQFTFNSEQTIIIWMKNQSPSSARRNPYDHAYAGAGTITHENDGVFNYYYGTGGGNNIPYTFHTSPFSVTVGETAQICITRNSTQTSWYKNGGLGNSLSNPYGASVVTGTNNITIGSGYAGYFGGNIYALQLYNRALTAAEVLQNFNAIRGLYGI